MPLDPATIEQIRHLVRPIATRTANTVARAVVQLVDDSTKMQGLQVSLLAGEVRGGAEHFLPYGFSCVPLAGAEGVALFPNGDRSHPIILATDRRYRPTNRPGGDVTMYHHTGAMVTFTEDGDIILEPAAGRKILARTAGGTPAALPTLAEFNAHTHPAPGGATSPPTTPATGTTVLEAQ